MTTTTATVDARPRPDTSARPSLYWLKLGFISFGGPAGQIAIMHEELVERRRWISEGRFLHALNYCMLLPGPEAQQLATYIGWLMHRTWGGIVAGVLFVLPSLFILIGLSWVYMAYGNVPAVAGIFYGIKPAVTAHRRARGLAHRLAGAEERLAVGHRGRRLPGHLRAASCRSRSSCWPPAPSATSAAATRRPSSRPAAATARRARSLGPALIDDDTPTPAHALFTWRALRPRAGRVPRRSGPLPSAA